MVLFTNINLNQKVEVKRHGKIYQGTVKFKGCINGVPGEWVGVELYHKAGRHDGMIKGRRYFSCTPGHGIFVPADKIRFSTEKRCLYNTYRSVERDPELLVEEELFGYERPESCNPYDPKSISATYYDTTKEGNFGYRDPFAREPSFHLRHSVSRSIPAATWLRPQTNRPLTPHRTASLRRSNSYGSGLNRSSIFDDDDSDDVVSDEFEEFISSPSIPRPHMPQSALKDQLRRGWETPHQHYPRDWSIHTGRESVKWDKWNDVSY